MPRDAGADKKDQRTDRSCAACDRMARTRRGKIRKKDTPASRADRPSSPNLPATTDRENHSEALVASTFSTKSARSRHPFYFPPPRPIGGLNHPIHTR